MVDIYYLFLYPSATECNTPLGMEDGTITDGQISASSEYPYSVSHGPANARLNFRGGNGRTGSWSVAPGDNNPWLKVDFLHETTVTGVITQGRPDACCPQWVSRYTVSYSQDGVNFQNYMENGQRKVCGLIIEVYLCGIFVLLFTSVDAAYL